MKHVAVLKDDGTIWGVKINEKKLIDTGGQDIYVGCSMAEPVYRAVTLTVEE